MVKRSWVRIVNLEEIALCCAFELAYFVAYLWRKLGKSGEACLMLVLLQVCVKLSIATCYRSIGVSVLRLWSSLSCGIVLIGIKYVSVPRKQILKWCRTSVCRKTIFQVLRVKTEEVPGDSCGMWWGRLFLVLARRRNRLTFLFNSWFLFRYLVVN